MPPGSPAKPFVLDEDGVLLSEQVDTTAIRVAAAMRLRLDGEAAGSAALARHTVMVDVSLPAGRACTLDKLVAVCTSRDPGADRSPGTRAVAEVDTAAPAAQTPLLDEHVAAWARIWEECDVVIAGDPAAQQGIRFSIFQMEQVYSGRDDTLNIGPRALSSLDHGGQYFWDTEAYMVPLTSSGRRPRRRGRCWCSAIARCLKRWRAPRNTAIAGRCTPGRRLTARRAPCPGNMLSSRCTSPPISPMRPGITTPPPATATFYSVMAQSCSCNAAAFGQIAPSSPPAEPAASTASPAPMNIPSRWTTTIIPMPWCVSFSAKPPPCSRCCAANRSKTTVPWLTAWR